MHPAPRVRRVLVFAIAAVVLGVGATQASAARPPIPAGAERLAPGHRPGVCTHSGDVKYGYYWSTRAKTWVSAP